MKPILRFLTMAFAVGARGDVAKQSGDLRNVGDELGDPIQFSANPVAEVDLRGGVEQKGFDLISKDSVEVQQWQSLDAKQERKDRIFAIGVGMYYLRHGLDDKHLTDKEAADEYYLSAVNNLKLDVEGILAKDREEIYRQNIEWLSDAIELDDDKFNFWERGENELKLGSLLGDRSILKDAIKDLSKEKDSMGYSSEQYELIGMAKQGLGKYREAFNEFATADELTPSENYDKKKRIALGLELFYKRNGKEVAPPPEEKLLKDHEREFGEIGEELRTLITSSAKITDEMRDKCRDYLDFEVSRNYKKREALSPLEFEMKFSAHFILHNDATLKSLDEVRHPYNNFLESFEKGYIYNILGEYKEADKSFEHARHLVRLEPEIESTIEKFDSMISQSKDWSNPSQRYEILAEGLSEKNFLKGERSERLAERYKTLVEKLAKDESLGLERVQLSRGDSSLRDERLRKERFAREERNSKKQNEEWWDKHKYEIITGVSAVAAVVTALAVAVVHFQRNRENPPAPRRLPLGEAPFRDEEEAKNHVKHYAANMDPFMQKDELSEGERRALLLMNKDEASKLLNAVSRTRPELVDSFLDQNLQRLNEVQARTILIDQLLENLQDRENITSEELRKILTDFYKENLKGGLASMADKSQEEILSNLFDKIEDFAESEGARESLGQRLVMDDLEILQTFIKAFKECIDHALTDEVVDGVPTNLIYNLIIKTHEPESEGGRPYRRHPQFNEPMLCDAVEIFMKEAIKTITDVHHEVWDENLVKDIFDEILDKVSKAAKDSPSSGVVKVKQAETLRGKIDESQVVH